MRKTKVFISSVIGGYEDRRGAAEEATIELNRDKSFNFEAIRTESNRHHAEDKSSQKVCSDGVKECDIYLGIYPKNNYGWGESPVGISPTHEEFRKARKCGKPCLIFVENTKETDFRQDDFLKEVGDYVEGRFWNKFEFGELDKLKHLVYRALLKLMEANFKNCLPTYLKFLLHEYERIDRLWDEDVDSLPVSEVVQLELREEEQKEEKKSLTKYGEIEKHSEELSKSLMFADAIKEKPRLLIIGDPGAGKSTSLQWITYSERMKQSKFPKGWDEEKVHKVLDHYEKQTEEEALVEDEAAYKDITQTTIDIPVELVPAVRELIAKHQTLQHPKTMADNSG